MSGLLLLTLVGLTTRTAFTVVTGDPTLYLMQPAVTSGLIGAVFFASMATTSPVVARLAGDFYPMCDDLADRPPVRRLFRRLTLLWGVVCLLKSAATTWLVLTMSMPNVVLAKTLSFPVLTAAAVGITVIAAVRVVRAEGLLPSRSLAGSPVPGDRLGTPAHEVPRRQRRSPGARHVEVRDERERGHALLLLAQDGVLPHRGEEPLAEAGL